MNAGTTRKKPLADAVIERTAHAFDGNLALHVHSACYTKPTLHERPQKELDRRQSSTSNLRALPRVIATIIPIASTSANTAMRRDNLSVTSNGRRLLNPTDAAWGDHFELTEAKLRPLNDDAAYTEQSYDINDPRRTVLRAERARVYDDHIPLIEQSDGILELLDLAKQQTNVEAKRAIIAAAELLRNAIQHALTDLRGYSIVPIDAPKACKCKDVELELPEAMVSQALSIRSPVEVVAPSE